MAPSLTRTLCWRIREVMNWLVNVHMLVNIRGQKSVCILGPLAVYSSVFLNVRVTTVIITYS